MLLPPRFGCSSGGHPASGRMLDVTRRSPDAFAPLILTSDDLDTLDESIAVRIPLRVWTNEPIEA
jgi:hypothetical protein